MKEDPEEKIHLIPEKKKRSLSDIPATLYLWGWLSIFLALAALIAVYLFLRHIGI